MATTGGKVSFRQPLSFADGNVSIGDNSSSIAAGSLRAVLVGGASSIDASCNDTVVVGNASSGLGSSSVVVGSSASASRYSVVIGYNAEATGDNEVVIGLSAMANLGGIGRVMIGSGVTSAAGSGSYSVLIGYGAYETGTGGSNIIIGKVSHGEGNTIGLGPDIDVAGEGTIAVGNNSYAHANYAIALGTRALNNTANSMVVGRNDLGGGDYAVHAFSVMGYNGAALYTVRAVDNPASGSTGLTVVFYNGSAYSNKTLKAATSGSVPGGSLYAYFDP